MESDLLNTNEILSRWSFLRNIERNGLQVEGGKSEAGGRIDVLWHHFVDLEPAGS